MRKCVKGRLRRWVKRGTRDLSQVSCTSCETMPMEVYVLRRPFGWGKWGIAVLSLIGKVRKKLH